MYSEYEHEKKFKFKIIIEGKLPNGLEVCVWRDVDNGVWGVTVVDPKDIWNDEYDEKFRDARGVLECIVALREIKKD